MAYLSLHALLRAFSGPYSMLIFGWLMLGDSHTHTLISANLNSISQLKTQSHCYLTGFSRVGRFKGFS